MDSSKPYLLPAGKLAAYTQLLVVPLMARMSDPLPAVRRAASPTFAALVALLPLAQVRQARGQGEAAP